MPDSMTEYEDWNGLGEVTKDLERARQSLVEELQAIDWYQERIDLTKNASLKKILEHNRDEEKEHVAMLMEWITKKDAVQSRAFKKHD
jgi:hypothetical protein